MVRRGVEEGSGIIRSVTRLIEVAIAALEQLPKDRQDVVVRAILNYASHEEGDE